MILVNSSTRQFIIPGSDLVFGVEDDSGSERKYFQCPRYVGDNLDLAACFIRINYRSANGKMDAYLVDDLVIDGDNITFSWLLSPKVTEYKGQIKFVMCAVGPDLKLKWHTTQGTGQALEGLEPDSSHIESQTADVVAQLIAMVDAQTVAVEEVGAEQAASVRSAAEIARTAAVNEIEAKRANSLASIPNDYTALSGAVESLVRGRAGAIVCEAAGSVVAVNDASDMALQGLHIFGRSTQDGIPTPEAPVEIVSVENPVVSVCGKNLVRESLNGSNSAEYAVALSCKLDNLESDTEYTVSFTGAPGHKIYANEALFAYQYILCDGKRQHLTVKTRPNVSKGNINQYSSNRWIIFKNSESNTVQANFAEVQIERGTICTEYEVNKPAQKVTVVTHDGLPGIPVTSGGNYTDEDGQQWIADEVDFERGVYVQRVENRKILSSDNWATMTAEGRYWLIEVGFYDVSVSAFCTHFSKADGWANHTLTDGTFIVHRDPSWDDGRLSFKDVRFTSLDEWKRFLDDNEVCVIYELATPIETPLSETEIAAYRALHSNYPNTTVLNDGGAHMIVKYAADTKTYIDNKIKEALK
ncbi:hypothetical protein [Succinimonas sp.]|uniref:hypothetical protein n=1 Tax=Succinimonas sp. TaxID=1936151 RepID=UPI003863EF81